MCMWWWHEKVRPIKPFNPVLYVIVISELGIQDDFEVILYNPYNVTEKEKQDYMANCHPHGFVPTLELPDGKVMFESVAINMFLAQKYNKLLPSGHYQSDYYM